MSAFFIRRPIVAMVISILTVLLGLVALRGLPVSQYPEITPPEIQVNAVYTGANAVDVEQSVATPLEQQVNGVERMIYMRSVNANDGTMSLRVDFEVGADLDMANVLVQNRVSQATASLPDAVKQYGVNIRKSLTFPLAVVTLRSPNNTYDANFLANYTTINVTDVISRIPGVGQVNLFGGSDYAMRIWIRPDRLGELKLTVADIRNALLQQNAITPAGQIGGPPAPTGTEFTYTVRTQGRLETPEQFGQILLRSNPDGSQVRLKDVARVELGTQLYNAAGRYKGVPAAVLAIYQTPGTNALAVVQKIRQALEQLSQRFPPDVNYLVSLDTTLAVSRGIQEIVQTLLEAVLLVIFVVFIFLQSWRATLIPLLTVPVALIGTFAVFPFLGFSVNVLSLLGLVLAIGIVVDDAIVVVEAVMHHIEQGLPPRQAALKAMEQVAGPVVAIALILTAVFVPVAFVSGITGRLYQQFAITIAISVLLSAFNALTLSPALAALLLRPAQEKRGPLGFIFRHFNAFFDRSTKRYLSLTSLLTRKLARSLILVGGVVILIPLFSSGLPQSFLPEEDQGYFLINAQLPDAASLQRTEQVCRKIEKILSQTSGIEGYNTVSGFSMITQSYASNFATFFVTMKDWEERGRKDWVFWILMRLNQQLAKEIPEAVVFAFGPPAIPGLGTGAGFSMMLQDRSGGTPQFLSEQADKFLAAAAKRPELARLFSAYRTSVPQFYADIDREKVYKLGVPLSDVNLTLGAGLGGSYINDFNRFGRTYKVYVQAEPAYRNDPRSLGLYYVRNTDNHMVPMSTLLKFAPSRGPEYTARFNLFRAAEITGVPAAGYSSGQALAALEEVAGQVLPPEMSYAWNAMSYQEKTAAGTAAVVFLFALVMVFLILAAQYESWSLPFSVLLGTPFAAFGAIFGLWLGRRISPEYVNNVFAQIGLVMLIGLAAKNAILIVEFARSGVEAGKAAAEAALEAAGLRLRPILMTAFAFILGVVPLVIASGAGAEARKVMGLAVFSGMLVATALGIFLIPVLFVFVERLAGRTQREKTKNE